MVGRGSASASGLYGTRWRKLRRAYLHLHPLCVMCKADGYVRAATELDHIVKHNGNRALFYDTGNLAGLCSDHHRGFKAKQERSGRVSQCDLRGNPVSTDSHWNR